MSIETMPKTVAANIENFAGRTWVLPRVLEWFEQNHERTLLVTGEPGTGKSALAAWLAGAGRAPAAPDAQRQLERIRSHVKAVHFCTSASGNTSPKAFAQNLAEQLGRRIAGFGLALAHSLADQIQISVNQHVETLAGNMTGVLIEKLDLGGLDDEPSFNRVVREPLKALYAKGYNESLLLLVDALDEAATYEGRTRIAQLLSGLEDLPVRVRFLATTRPDPRVLKLFREARRVDLIRDAPQEANDIELYAFERLSTIDAAGRMDLATRISRAADGNFLYAHLVLNDLVRLPVIPDLQKIPLPSGLGGIYHQFLNRELGADELRWYETFQPLLGLVAVAQGEGLHLTQLQQITRDPTKLEPALRACAQYLDGVPQGPFRTFHKSFADFLLEDPENTDYHVNAGDMNQRIADHYWAIRNGAARWSKWNDYGVRHAATHLAAAAQGSLQPQRHDDVQRLVDLVSDRDFQTIHKQRMKDVLALGRILEQAMRAAAIDDDPLAVVLLVKSAMSLLAFRREELRPEPIFELARHGDVDAAERRFSLFEVDAEWRSAVLLIIAWLAAGSRPAATRRLRDRVQAMLPQSDTLQRLLSHVNRALDGSPVPAVPLPPPSADLVREVVARLGGEGDQTELLATVGLIRAGYLAEHDAPVLVAFAAHHPVEGNEYFKQYVAIHSGYSYVEYRRGSLWFLLDGALRHPDPQWVEAQVPPLAASALAGSNLEFQESLPVTVLGLKAAAQQPGALQELESRRDQAMAAADKLEPSRGHGDTWGSHKRRLASLAQVFSQILARHADAAKLLNRACNLPYGFAGFQAPVLLNLAEAMHICQPAHAAISGVFGAAHNAAHNIQDATFCVRTTARVNAMTRRWWNPFDVASATRDLCHDPSAPRFATLHDIGEQYAGRSNVGMALPHELRQANTLRALAGIYHRPLAEFERLNQQEGWTADQILPLGTEVNVPDGGFATLLAGRFAAEALVNTQLSGPERVSLIQSLVPLAATHPTTLDNILARLLLAARPSGPAVLDELQTLAARNLAESGPAELRVQSVIPS